MSDMDMQLPEAFAERMKGLLSVEWEDFLYCYKNDRYQALRFNPLKKGLTEEKYTQVLAQLEEAAEAKEAGNVKPVPWAKHAFYYDDSMRPGKHPYHEAGLYYIQEPSAMSAAAMLAPQPGMRVLDLCAAPGGKTTQLASYLNQQGLLVANEIHPARCKILSQNVERLGIRNAIVTNEDSRKLAEHFPLYFHAILVDAPCSGEGMFRKNPEAMEEWSPKQVIACAERQREILDNAAEMLMAGGTLVYSTCTFSPEENEQTIAHFLAKHEEFELVERDAPWFSPGRPDWAANGVAEDGGKTLDGEEALIGMETSATAPHLEKTFRLWPHHLHGEGHYVAVLKKKGTLPDYRKCEESDTCVPELRLQKTQSGKKNSGKKDALDREQQKAFAEFAKSTLSEEMTAWILGGNLVLFGDQLYRLPEDAPPIKGLKVLRAGLHIGEFKKNRFEPSHALALTMGKEDVCRFVDIKSDDARTRAYFAGESLSVAPEEIIPAEAEKKGWALLCIDGFSAGWGKLGGNQLKNHYPKGLRRVL